MTTTIKPPLLPRHIFSACAVVMGVSECDMLASKKNRMTDVAAARWVYAALCRIWTNASYPEIATPLGVNHSSAVSQEQYFYRNHTRRITTGSGRTITLDQAAEEVMDGLLRDYRVVVG